MVKDLATNNRLFSDLRQGAPLRWFAFQYEAGGPLHTDVTEAIARRRAGLPVRLWPRGLIAYRWMARGPEASAS